MVFPMSPTDALSDFGRSYLRLAAEVWTRSLDVTSSYGLRAINHALAHWGNLNQPHLRQTAALEMQNYFIEMASLIPFAIERFVTEELPGRERRGAAGLVSHPGKSHLIGDKAMMLPVRIAEASQGWALYFVPSEWAQSRLGERDKQFVLVHAGLARTPLIIFGIDHRKSDLGSYHEIGVALLVRPRSNPRDLPGLLFLALIVNGQFTIDASRMLWGYHKALAGNMDVRYGDRFATFCVDAQDAATLSISFPRFGGSRSSGVPCYIYSVPDHAKDGAAHRTVLSRSATGEGVQFGGAVELHLSNRPNCVCQSGSRSDAMCLCSMLRDLRLPERPAANGWAEHVSGTFGPATPCT